MAVAGKEILEALSAPFADNDIEWRARAMRFLISK